MKIHHLNSIIIFMAIFSTLALGGVETFAIDAPVTATVPTEQTTVPTVQTIAPLGQVAPANTTVQTPVTQKTPALNPETDKQTFKRPSPILKFLLAMLGVVVSSLAIFGGLKFYKKFVLKKSSKTDNIDYNKSLESPKTFKEAINIFLDKTDK